uniref:Uncharacterized protein n=1 Tax=Solibacter usitatus (strain Ellin6076) TaxID=234267 RepID=Q02CW8_SOLUE
MWRNAAAILTCAALAHGANALDEFQRRIADYVKVHEQAQSSTGKLKPTTSAARIADHEQELASRIREAREGVVEGNIFTARTGKVFRRLLAHATGGRDATTVHQSLRRSEPVVVPLRVNEAYPERVPLQTTPPSVLQYLPKLPPQLEYRVVGRALVLRDTGANLIVDFLPNALP